MRRRAVARADPGRARGRRAAQRAWWSRARRAAARATGDILAYLDADCRAPLTWLERVERRFERDPALVALTGPYRFYDWDWWGRALIRAYDFTRRAADAAARASTCSRIGAILYGGNFAVRREALERDRRLRHARSSFTAKTPTSAGG